MTPSTPTAEQRLWLTPQEVADELRFSRLTVYRMIDQGEIPAVKFGTKVRIPADFMTRSRSDAWAGVVVPISRDDT